MSDLKGFKASLTPEQLAKFQASMIAASAGIGASMSAAARMVQETDEDLKRRAIEAFDERLAKEQYDATKISVALKQLQERETAAELEALAKFRTAWSLYRTGGASIEEITPLMDSALEMSLPEDDDAEPGVEGRAAWRPELPALIPVSIAVPGKSFEFGGARYNVDEVLLTPAERKAKVSKEGAVICANGKPRGFWVKVNT